jgi:hypothetical protein
VKVDVLPIARLAKRFATFVTSCGVGLGYRRARIIVVREFARIDKWNGERVGAPDAEVRAGDSYSISLGRWVDYHRNIDWASDWYDEVITDPLDGSVIREVHEPLSAHGGRGSAKLKA